MAAYGNQIVGRPASWFDWCDDDNQLPIIIVAVMADRGVTA
jgi:hypothetical protein